MIPSSTIDDIRNKADILQVIGEYVPLKKRGKNYIGLCPFHSEKTPSFTVSPEKQIFHCFGCGEGGNIYAFLMKTENISFAESVEILGERVGIKVKADAASSVLRSEKEKYFKIMEMAQDFYRGGIESDSGIEAARYLEGRNITPETAKVFGLGYSPDQWDLLMNYLFRHGVDKSDMVKLGLIIERNDKSGYYDRFRGRLMFPIYNLKGGVIGYSGRLIRSNPSEEEAKYINSPDSPIYNKGFCLYGINAAKDEIRRTKTAVLVEGNLDLITCWQSGVKNVIAPLGTALTSNQAKTIRRFADEAIIAFDKDSAGNSATARSVDILKDEGLNVRIADYTGGKDPDEAIRSKGADHFLKAVKDARPWMEFIVLHTISKHNIKEIEGRAKAAKEVTSIIGRENEELVRKEYIKLAADRLGFSPDELASEVKRQGFYLKKGGDASFKRTVEKPESKLVKAEESLIKLAVSNPQLITSLSWEEFTDKDTRMIAELLKSVEMNKIDIAHFLLENLPDDRSKKLFSRIMMEEQPGENPERMVKDCINTVKGHHLKAKMEILRSKMAEAEKDGQHDNVSLLHKEYQDMSEAYRSLS